jgi:hypothetical protein
VGAEVLVKLIEDALLLHVVVGEGLGFPESDDFVTIGQKNRGRELTELEPLRDQLFGDVQTRGDVGRGLSLVYNGTKASNCQPRASGPG